MEDVVVIKNLEKSFGSIKAVDSISFTIKKGEIFGLLGPNGAGKTTTINMISCLSVPNNGEITVYGYNVKKEPQKVKQQLGLVPQFNSLDEEITALQNLTFYASYYSIPEMQSKPVALELLKLIGLLERKDENIAGFSGGMKQRLLLARALVTEPKFLILDEPTIGLDPQVRRKIWEYINEFRKKGITILLTTHYLDEADELCDRIGIIDHGKILMIDTPHHLKKKVLSESRVEIKVSSLPPKLEEELKTIEHVVEVKCHDHQDEKHIIIFANNVADCIIQIDKTIKKHTALLHMGIKDMSLEDVFIRLTGEEMRDAK
ncbi:ATP-binding cassette domain-containing protein [Candidatus Woesearchaeota archaeon]|nr:ATP-binding cassette domain-containing protein [Candidatus Woesearchaeota archaeon]